MTTEELIEALLISISICKIYLEKENPKTAELYLERIKRQWILFRPQTLHTQN